MSLDYSELLNNPKWKSKRNEILKRDNHQCIKCGSTDDLHCHHVYYNFPLTNPWEYPNQALITLCSKCHDDVHERDSKRKKKLKDGQIMANEITRLRGEVTRLKNKTPTNINTIHGNIEAMVTTIDELKNAINVKNQTIEILNNRLKSQIKIANDSELESMKEKTRHLMNYLQNVVNNEIMYFKQDEL